MKKYAHLTKHCSNSQSSGSHPSTGQIYRRASDSRGGAEGGVGAGSWGARWLTKRAAAKILISCLCLQKLQFFSRVSYDIESQQTGEKGHTTKKVDDFDVPSLPLCAWWSKLFWYCWETWGSKSQQASMAIILRVPLGSRSVTVE